MENRRIGISLRIDDITKYGEKRDAISQEWIKLLEECNIIPILIPNSLKNVKNFIQDLDLKGIILSGGDNIGDYPDRDETENQLIEYSLEESIPVLGVCRGMQILNKFFGGDIIKNGSDEHVRINHNVKIADLKFKKLFTEDEIEVNSFHKNIITKEKLHDDLAIFAIDERDDTVEGYYHKKFPIIGVMWHPERTYNDKSFLLINDIFRG